MINKFIKLDKPLILALRLIADREKQTLNEVVNKMLLFSLQHRQEKAKNLRHWQTLTRREKQILALICLSYTNKEIADQLFIAASTVKTHTRNLRRKFGCHSKLELRANLSDWDFSQWDSARPGEFNGI